MFTVPPGGDGLYYFSTYLLISAGEYGIFNMVVNDVIICSAYGDENSNSGSDVPQATCSAVVDVAEGKGLLLFLGNEFGLNMISVGWSEISPIRTICSCLEQIPQLYVVQNKIYHNFRKLKL